MILLLIRVVFASSFWKSHFENPPQQHYHYQYHHLQHHLQHHPHPNHYQYHHLQHHLQHHPHPNHYHENQQKHLSVVIGYYKCNHNL